MHVSNRSVDGRSGIAGRALAFHMVDQNMVSLSPPGLMIPKQRVSNSSTLQDVVPKQTKNNQT